MHSGNDDQMRLQVDIPEDLKTRLKIYSVTEGVTMSDVVEKAIADYLDKAEKSKSKK